MELNNIGKIVSTHGLKGEVKVKTDSSFIDERFKVGETVYIKENGKDKALKVVSHRSMNGFELVQFEGYDDCDKAMFLRNKELYALKKRELLKEDEVFYSDYVGLDVLYFGEIVGKVNGLLEFPQGTYLDITSKDGSQKVVPIRKEFIEKVDLKEKIVKIVDMEGLL